MTTAPSQALRRLVPARYRSQIAGFVRPLRYRGDEVTCPCCDGRFSSFRHHRDVPDVRCPRCGALERHRMLWLYFAQHSELLADDLEILHFAPEHSLRRLFADRRRYVSADLDSPLAQDQVDITAMPYNDERFDGIICSHVLEHVPDDAAGMREMVRVLKTGGWAVVMCPVANDRPRTYEDAAVTTPEERLKHFRQEDHVRLYGRDFKDRLEAAGFRVEVDAFATRVDADLAARLRLNTDDEIYFCVKP